MPTNTLFMTGLLCVWYAISATANPRYRNQWGRSVISPRALAPARCHSARPNSPGTLLIHLRDEGEECPRPVRGTPRCALWHREGKDPRASARQETVIYGTQHEAEEKFPPPACEKRWKDGGSGGIIVR